MGGGTQVYFVERHDIDSYSIRGVFFSLGEPIPNLSDVDFSSSKEYRGPINEVLNAVVGYDRGGVLIFATNLGIGDSQRLVGLTRHFSP